MKRAVSCLHEDVRLGVVQAVDDGQGVPDEAHVQVQHQNVHLQQHRRDSIVAQIQITKGMTELTPLLIALGKWSSLSSPICSKADGSGAPCDGNDVCAAVTMPNDKYDKQPHQHCAYRVEMRILKVNAWKM